MINPVYFSYKITWISFALQQSRSTSLPKVNRSEIMPNVDTTRQGHLLPVVDHDT